jgi:hypothetical protein
MPVNLAGGAAGIYWNSGTYLSPTWVEQTQVKDVSPKFPWKMPDASARSSAVALVVKANMDLEVEVTMRADPLEPQYVTAPTATGPTAGWTNNAYSRTANVDMLILNAKLSVVGAAGVRANFLISEDQEPQEIEGAVIATFKLKPTLSFYTANSNTFNIYPNWAYVSTANTPTYTPITFAT